MGSQVLRICRSERLDIGLKRVSWVRRYQGQCRALRPLGHQGYRLRNHRKDPRLCSGYTSVPDIPRFTGPTRAFVHDRLGGLPQLVISPRRMEPLLEKPQGTAGPHMTTGLMGPLEQPLDCVARHDYPVLMPEVGLVSFPLFLVDQDGFQTLLHAFVDIPKLLQVLHLSESI